MVCYQFSKLLITIIMYLDNHDHRNHDNLIIVTKNNNNISIFNDNCPTLVPTKINPVAITQINRPGYSAKAGCSVPCSKNWHFNLKSSRQLIKLFNRNGSARWKKGRNKIISVKKAYFSQLPAYISIKYIQLPFFITSDQIFYFKKWIVKRPETTF